MFLLSCICLSACLLLWSPVISSPGPGILLNLLKRHNDDWLLTTLAWNYTLNALFQPSLAAEPQTTPRHIPQSSQLRPQNQFAFFWSGKAGRVSWHLVPGPLSFNKWCTIMLCNPVEIIKSDITALPWNGLMRSVPMHSNRTSIVCSGCKSTFGMAGWFISWHSKLDDHHGYTSPGIAGQYDEAIILFRVLCSSSMKVSQLTWSTWSILCNQHKIVAKFGSFGT